MRLIRLTLIIGLLCLLFPITAQAAGPGPVLLAPIAQDAPPEDAEQPAAEEPDAFTNIENVLGTLGIFSAFMLILAVGTEVTIDSLKVVAGFKSKPTAMDTVNQLKEWLPGSLEKMGASGDNVARLKATLDAMAGHMGKVDDATTAITTINEWLPDYLKNFSVDKLQEMLTTKLPELRTELGAKIGPQNVDVALGWLRGALATLSATSVSSLTDQARELVREFDWLTKEDGQAIADQIATVLQDKLPNDMSALAQGGQKLLDERLPHIIATLSANGVDTRVIDQVKNWLGGALSALGTGDSTAYTAAVGNLMQAVEDRRDNIHSWIGKIVRRLFRWLKSGKLYRDLKDNNFVKRVLDRIDRFQSGDHIIPPLNPGNIARVLMERDSAHREEEVSRLRWLRVVSVVIGVTLAIMLRVDVGELLQPIISEKLHATLVTNVWELECVTPTDPELASQFTPAGWCSKQIFNKKISDFQLLHVVSIGMLLSGLAASAGSAFWHDMLDRLQAAKKAAGEIKDLAAQIQALEQGKK